jgi:hypothetical protein
VDRIGDGQRLAQARRTRDATQIRNFCSGHIDGQAALVIGRARARHRVWVRRPALPERLLL